MPSSLVTRMRITNASLPAPQHQAYEAERRHNVPSPLEGEGQGGGRSQTYESVATPLPTPPPQGGREQAELAARSSYQTTFQHRASLLPLNRLQPTHIALQHIRHRDGAVILLIGFHYGDQRAADGDARA